MGIYNVSLINVIEYVISGPSKYNTQTNTLKSGDNKNLFPNSQTGIIPDDIKQTLIKAITRMVIMRLDKRYAGARSRE